MSWSPVVGWLGTISSHFVSFRKLVHTMSTSATINAQEALEVVTKHADGLAQYQADYRDKTGTGPGEPANLTGGMTENVDVIPQGDLYLMSINEQVWSRKGDKATLKFKRNRNGTSEDITLNYKLVEKPQVQLVPGESAGAKHCLADYDCVEYMYIPEDWGLESLFGPVFQLKAGKGGVITHPTHGYINIDAGLLVFAFYQRNQDQEAKMERRAAD